MHPTGGAECEWDRGGDSLCRVLTFTRILDCGGEHEESGRSIHSRGRGAGPGRVRTVDYVHRARVHHRYAAARNRDQQPIQLDLDQPWDLVLAFRAPLAWAMPDPRKNL